MWKKLKRLKLFILMLIFSVTFFSILKFINKADVQDMTITRTSVGGFSGTGDGKNFALANSKASSGSNVKPVSQVQLSLIADKLNEIDFFNLKSEYLCNCADQFINKLSIKLGNQSNVVTFEDGSDAPTGLIGLDTYLQTLAP